MPYLQRADVKLYYEDVGAGRPLLLIHGDWSCSQEILAVHAGWAEHRRLIAPDRRGYGRSTHLTEQPDDLYGVHAEDMAALLEHLGITQADVFGFSGGGIVALRLALARPAMVRSLVLECTHYSADMPPQARDWFRRLKQELESLPPATIQSLITCHGEEYWRELLRVFAASSERIFFRGGDLYDGRLSQISVPHPHPARQSRPIYHGRTCPRAGRGDTWRGTAYLSPRPARPLRPFGAGDRGRMPPAGRSFLETTGHRSW
jgi:pimeloyl-ACP methyl ester carboxylesterase